MFSPSDYLDFSETDHGLLFTEGEPVWAALGKLESYLDRLLKSTEGTLVHGSIHPTATVGSRVYVATGAVIEANAVVQGPAWIGPGTVVRSGAYLRQNVIAGSHCVLGNSSEFKNCLLFNDCEVPHFNYVGDSILGHRAHLGAGVICSNVRLDRENVRLRLDDGEIVETGLRKFGVIVGDRTEVGCNSVLSPGSILGRDCVLYPVTHWQGVLEENKIVKHKPPLDVVDRDL
ncbi:MAG: UDP-N-acetylglucosamine diphosphorylase [Verrucomicrobiales bacterium]|nr:UDP-N-acetylglucosamine diphosphorylase [Verrucomicrobiales bacterium]